eukprot:SAG31_NODE_7681_length_1618_cov_1.584595_1_plen_114_part_00
MQSNSVAISAQAPAPAHLARSCSLSVLANELTAEIIFKNFDWNRPIAVRIGAPAHIRVRTTSHMLPAVQRLSAMQRLSPISAAFVLAAVASTSGPVTRTMAWAAAVAEPMLTA